MSIRSLLRNYLGMEQREIDVNYGMMRLASQAATNSSAIVDLNNRSTELDGRVTGQINDLVTRVTNEIRRVNGRIQRSERRTENCEAGIGQMNYMLLAQRPNASGSEGQESLEDGDAFKQANENLNQAGIGSPDGIYRDPGKMLPPTPGYRPTKWRKAVKRIEDLPVIGDALIGLATPFAIPTAAATAIDGSKIKSLYEERKGTVGKVIGGLACAGILGALHVYCNVDLKTMAEAALATNFLSAAGEMLDYQFNAVKPDQDGNIDNTEYILKKNRTPPAGKKEKKGNSTQS